MNILNLVVRGYSVCILFSILFVAYLVIGSKISDRCQKAKDDEIFKVAEEARNDFK